MFKIIWDKPNNGVLLTLSTSEETLAVAPRPVFYEELDLLGAAKFFDYPRTAAPLLWACDRRYFYKGEIVFEAKGGNIYDAPLLAIHAAAESGRIEFQPVDLKLLTQNNEELMFYREYEALDFIHNTWHTYSRLKNTRKAATANVHLDYEAMRDKYQKLDKRPLAIVRQDCDSFDIMPLEKAEAQGKQTLLSTKTEMFIVSFSGGKDSQVLLDLVSRAIPPDAYHVIYSNTGYEIPPSLTIYEETKKHYQSLYPELRFHLSKNHQDVLYYWDKLGAPSNIFRWCCGIMKTAPLYRELKEVSGLQRQPHILTFDGIRAEESIKRSHYQRIGKGVKHNNVINASPILAWNVFEIYLYLFSKELPFNKAYRSGVTRAGCVTCPFGSDWNDHFCNKLYPETITPFTTKIRELVKKSGVPDVDNYIKEGNWKIRAGGRELDADFTLNIISQTPDFKAIIKNPQEDFLTWLKVLGNYTVNRLENKTFVNLKYKKNIIEIILNEDSKHHSTTIEVKNTSNEILFLSHFKKILNKTVCCTHCESCEVECPTGALSVVPTVTVNEQKCIHCFACLDFDDKGCITAKSLATTTGNKMTTKNINRYNNFGLRESWLTKFFQGPETFFTNDEHGLNIRHQIPPLKNWLQEAEILKLPQVKPTRTGTLLAKKYNTFSQSVWEIIWINLTINSEIARWYSTAIPFDRPLSVTEIEVLLTEHYAATSNYSGTTLRNALGALRNTFKESPLGDEVGVGILTDKTSILRKTASSLSLPSVAYSLYRYAELKQRHNLTVGEFYKDANKEGIFRQFGIPRDTLETVLRTLTEEKNRVLHADLNMGLDNINLREDLSAFDVLEILL